MKTQSKTFQPPEIAPAEAARLRRETITKPVIYIGTGTCGLGAGAAATLSETERFLAEAKIDADIIQVGCIGICALEPLLDVQLPGRPRLSFSQVTSDKVERILGGIFDTETVDESAIFQISGPEQTPWSGVPMLEEHPFFARQTRWVLKNCGLIDPGRIEEYLARGGYQALSKAINTLTPSEVCDEVEKSELRGRGGGGFIAGRKWRFALGTAANQKYMICNADEGEPGTWKDRIIMENDPHLLLLFP